MTSDKKQLLDPISTLSRIILLSFYPEKTKLRIHDHCVQLVENTIIELFYRNYYHDTRNDICVLYPIFIRYIELYLLEKQNKIKQKKSSLFSKSKSNEEVNENNTDGLCYDYLKKIAEYTINGLKILQKTYEYDNVVFSLQYFINILQSAIDGTYSDTILPDHLIGITNGCLLDKNKVQQIWSDTHIIELGETFEKCFETKKNNDEILLESNKKKIINILEKRDEEFRNKIIKDLK